MKRSLLVAVLAALMVTAIGASAAFAGEITGNGKSLKNDDGTLNGHSACAFSGLNDTSTGDPEGPDADGFFRTQSWGQIPKEVRDFVGTVGLHPGDACNPTIGEPGL
ncbi:MAG TPA: hypothetical protein VGB33_09365 [Acidimicrobiia bacterium]|jgi:hypothetical protein